MIHIPTMRVHPVGQAIRGRFRPWTSSVSESAGPRRSTTKVAVGTVQVWGTGGRRVLGFALASLVPAAVVTLLLVNQPYMADQPVFPLLRLPLAVVALGLARRPS